MKYTTDERVFPFDADFKLRLPNVGTILNEHMLFLDNDLCKITIPSKLMFALYREVKTVKDSLKHGKPPSLNDNVNKNMSTFNHVICVYQQEP